MDGATLTVAIPVLAAGVGSAVTWAVLRGPRARLRAERDARDAEARAARGRTTLLASVLEHAPTAIVLYANLGAIAFSNAAARELFAEGGSLDGMNFLTLLGSAPAPLRDAALAEEDTVFGVEQAGAHDSYRLAKRHLTFDGEPHTILLVERLTRALSRNEAGGYKRLIRLLCHELNNSLAPVTSLVHTARAVLQNPSKIDRLGTVLDTIEGRTTHLRAFIDGYAQFARLPKPHPATVPWSDFLARLSTLLPRVTFAAAPPGDGWIDAPQVEQAVINLLKNALEAGGPEGSVELSIQPMADGGARLVALDRGAGMSAEVRAQAFLPFFSTKEGGNGLGLPLCKEIAEGHGGTLELAAREGGGLRATMTLPGRAPPASIAGAARLTLTRG